MPKLLITLIDWEYPAHGELPHPQVWDLQQEGKLMMLYLAFANGTIVEMQVEGDSPEALEVLRGLLVGVGHCVPMTLSATERANAWLHADGYDCYQQGGRSPAYIFVNPVPQPEKFIEALDD